MYTVGTWYTLSRLKVLPEYVTLCTLPTSGAMKIVERFLLQQRQCTTPTVIVVGFSGILSITAKNEYETCTKERNIRKKLISQTWSGPSELRRTWCLHLEIPCAKQYAFPGSASKICPPVWTWLFEHVALVFLLSCSLPSCCCSLLGACTFRALPFGRLVGNWLPLDRFCVVAIAGDK